MNQPTREEFEAFKAEIREEVRQEVQKLREQITEPIQVTRIEVASEDVVKRLDKLEENTDVLKIEMQGARADISNLKATQSDHSAFFIEHGQRLKAIEEKQDTHSELLAQLISVGESHTNRFDKIEDTLSEHSNRFVHIDQHFDQIGQRFDQIDQVLQEVLRRLPERGTSSELKQTISETLALFVEKARKLSELSFTKSIKDTGLSYSWRAESGNIIFEQRGPSDELIDAFVLTLRLFIQDNERISFRRMSEFVNDPDLSVNWKERFEEARTRLNKFLDDPTDPVITNGTSELARRFILDIFLYGGLAHANKDKKHVFDNWKSNELIFPFIQSEFIRMLLVIFASIDYVSLWTTKELELIA